MQSTPSTIHAHRTVGGMFPLQIACVLGLIGWMGACGGSGTSASEPAPTAPDVKSSLEGLGIDVHETPRLDDNGSPLPGDFSPLGKTFPVDPLMEIFVGGYQLDNSTAVASLIEDLSQSVPAGDGTIIPQPLFEESSADAPWWSENLPGNSFPQTLRASAAGDLDGDGIQEIVTVFAQDPQLKLQIIKKGDAGYETSESTVLFNTPNITNVAVACGDFDGDSRDDIAVGYSANGQAVLLHLARDPSGAYTIEPNASRVFYPNLANPSMELILKSGNFDDDAPRELVVVLNERGGNYSNPAMTSRYWIFDGKASGYHELDSGYVEGFVPGVGLEVAAVADVAVGDIDGDNRDEIVFGGLASLDHGCMGSQYVLVALDDSTHGFAPLGASLRTVDFDGCADGPNPFDVRFVHVNTLDIDGDGVAEVICNQLVFEDWAHAAPWTLVPEYSLSSQQIVDDTMPQSLFDRSNSAMAVGDVNGDGRDDILIYSDLVDSQNNPVGLRVFGLPPGATQVTELGHIPAASAHHLINPILLTANVDKDTKVVRFTGQKSFAYIQPIVAAVIAAPPCKFGIGQNTSVCQSTFGNTSSQGTEVDRSASFSVSGLVGVKNPVPIGFDYELSAKLTLKATFSKSESYSLEKSVNFTTGANEDTVVFTTTPVDIYQYQIIQHPDPTFVGKFMDVQMPREPIFLQVERSFYNAHVAPGGLVVDDSILSHTIGEPHSYPTAAQKTALLAQYGGLENGPQAVGQGTGQTELELVVGEEWSHGGSLEMEFELSAETTLAGYKIELSVGTSVEDGIQWSSGQSTTYSGVVGSIPAEHFQAEDYSFGLFTYPRLDPSNGQQFEVIDYWVQ